MPHFDPFRMFPSFVDISFFFPHSVHCWHFVFPIRHFVGKDRLTENWSYHQREKAKKKMLDKIADQKPRPETQRDEAPEVTKDWTMNSKSKHIFNIGGKWEKNGYWCLKMNNTRENEVSHFHPKSLNVKIYKKFLPIFLLWFSHIFLDFF